MTDSLVRSAGATGKRDRLIAAARDAFHQHGIERSTLATVAEAADVPIGNVYYYFRTKDELVRAVIDSHVADVLAMTGSLGALRTPKARLKALARALTDQRDLAAEYGCPHGTLCVELDKRDSELAEYAAQIMTAVIAWAEVQFREMGRSDARDLAVALIAAYQGISVLTNALHDPELMSREAKRIERWIDSLDAG